MKILDDLEETLKARLSGFTCELPEEIATLWKDYGINKEILASTKGDYLKRCLTTFNLVAILDDIRAHIEDLTAQQEKG